MTSLNVTLNMYAFVIRSQILVRPRNAGTRWEVAKARAELLPSSLQIIVEAHKTCLKLALKQRTKIVQKGLEESLQNSVEVRFFSRTKSPVDFTLELV